MSDRWLINELKNFFSKTGQNFQLSHQGSFTEALLMISVVAIPSDYSSSIYALVNPSSSSTAAFISNLPIELEAILPQSAPTLLSAPPANRSDGEATAILLGADSREEANPISTPASVSATPAIGASPSSASEASASSRNPVTPTQSPLTSVHSPSLQFVKAISNWSSGISESLQFDAPLVAIIESQNPRSLTSPSVEASDSKSLSSVKGGGVSGSPHHEQRNCLAADEMLPKPAFDKVFQVQVKGQTIANLPTQSQADILAQRLEQILKAPDFNPETLQAEIDNLTPIGKARETTLFQIDPELTSQFDRNPELLAISWINNLRSALEVAPVPIAEAQSQMHTLTVTQKQLKGNASWYDPSFAGSPTATGETFDPVKMTAAHPTLPFGTYLKVTNQETHDSVIVRINDRGPYLEERSLDLSGEAARCLNSEVSGVVPYEAVVMENLQTQIQTQIQTEASQSTVQPTAQSTAPSTPNEAGTN